MSQPVRQEDWLRDFNEMSQRVTNLERYSARREFRTDLPQDPYDGQEILLYVSAVRASSLSGVVWRAVYVGTLPDGSANPDTYKWHVIDHEDIYDESAGPCGFTTNASAGVRSNTWTTNQPPAITYPFAGDYEVFANCVVGTDGTGTYGLSIGEGTSEYTLANANRFTIQAINEFTNWSQFASVTGRSSGAVVAFMHNSPNGGAMTGRLYEVRLVVRPLRIG